MLKPELIIIGHIMIETVYLSNNNIVGPVLGSPAGYSSVAASRLDIKTGLVTIIGKDMPYYIVSPIIKAGVDTRGIYIKGKYSRLTRLIYDKEGNKKVFYEKVPPDILFKNIPKEYLKSQAYFVCPIDFEVHFETISELKKLNKLMMTDLSGFGGTVSTIHPSTGEQNIKNLVRDITGSFNVVKASIEDCYYLFKNNITPKKSIEILHRWGPKVVIITLGKGGSIISNGKDLIEIPIFQTKIVDTTGAGDIYCTAFLVEYLKTNDLFKSGLYASAASSVLIEKTGGVTLSRMPTDKDVRKRIKKIYNQVG